MYHHVHPLTILIYLWRVLYLVIIPLGRGALSAFRGDFSSWVRGAWIDILILLLMLGIAMARWWCVTYRYNDEGLAMKTGLIIRDEIQIRWDKITTLSMVQSWYLRPFRAARLRADTLGGGDRHSDFTVLIPKRRAYQLLSRVRKESGKTVAKHYVPRTASILALALLTSNSLAGIIFVATFISQSGRILGREFSDRLIVTFEDLARFLAFGLPPAAVAIAYVLLIGWMIAFLLTYTRYLNFAASRREQSLNIGGGALSNRQYCIRYDDINFIDIRQSVTTKLLRLYSLYVSAVGYGKQRDDISCIIPTENKEIFHLHLNRLFPAYGPAKRQLTPPKNGIMRFIGPPLTLCLCIPAVMLLCFYLFAAMHRFILFVGLMSLAPSLFFLAVRIVDFATGGCSKEGDYYTLRYSHGFYLHTVVVPAEKIASVELAQGFYQKFTPNCDLVIRTRAEVRAVHRCRNLNKEEAARLMGLVDDK